MQSQKEKFKASRKYILFCNTKLLSNDEPHHEEITQQNKNVSEKWVHGRGESGMHNMILSRNNP